MTDIRALIESLEACPVGDGDLIGDPFRVLPYQRRFLRGAFRDGVLRAGCSLSRGGGKTGLASALCLDAIRPAGVLHREGGETVLVASSFAQARLGFEAVIRSLELMGEESEFRIRDQQNLADLSAQAFQRRGFASPASDNRRAHGWRFNLAICDEPSAVGAVGRAAWLPRSARRSASGRARRALFIGTRPASDAHFFARLLAEERSELPYSQLTYAAGAGRSTVPGPDLAESESRRLNAGLPDVGGACGRKRASRSAILQNWQRSGHCG